MLEQLPKEVLAGFAAARRRARRRGKRLRVHSAGNSYVVHRLWDSGLAIDADDAAHLGGLVDIYDGTRHLMQCLIVASSVEADELIFEFKRHTAARDSVPVDFVQEENSPVALIEKG